MASYYHFDDDFQDAHHATQQDYYFFPLFDTNGDWQEDWRGDDATNQSVGAYSKIYHADGYFQPWGTAHHTH